MKRILIFVLTLCLILALFTNCSDPDDNKQSNEENNQQVKDIFLSRSGEGNIGTSSDVIADASEYGIDTMWETTTLDDMKNKEKNIAGEDRTFKYAKTKMFYKNSESKDYGTFYSVYDTYSYKNEDGTIWVEWDLLHNTDIITRYSSNEAKHTNLDAVYEEITEEKGKKIAEQFLQNFISDEVFEKFTYYKFEKLYERTAITYMRYIEDYQTDEMLTVYIHKSGVVSGYNGVNLQKYDSLLNSLTKEKLDAAHNKLKDKIESFNDKKVVYYKPIVVTDTSGNPYLELFYSCNDGMIESLLVNIH